MQPECKGGAEDCMEVMDMVTVVAELLELLMVEAEAVVVIKTLQLISYLLSWTPWHLNNDRPSSKEGPPVAYKP